MTRHRSLLILFGLLGIGPRALAQTRSAVDAERDGFVRQMMKSAGMPGVQTVVVKHGRIVWEQSYGQAVLAQPGPLRPMRPNSILFVCSLGKVPTAVAIMQQVEKGKIGLDDDINRSLPFPVRNPRWPDVPITWRMLLTHTSSINDPDGILDSIYVYGRDAAGTLADFARDLFTPAGRYYRADLYLDSKPGASRIYSNVAFDLAGYALEQVVHESFTTYVTREVLVPLRMEGTSFFLRDLPERRLAVGYGRTPRAGGGFDFIPNGVWFGKRPAGHSVMQEMFSAPDPPSGLLFTSATQYARLMMLLMNHGTLDGVKLLEPATVDSMLTPSGFWSIHGYQQGLTLYAQRNLQEHLVWGHDGQDRGYVAAMFFDRETGIGAVAFANANSDDQELSRYLVDLTMHMMDWFK
jgi:CubicO group peptidase (beta-lactamase class C family)